MLTSQVTLRAAAFSVEPPEEGTHHLGAAEALETGTDVLMVPLQSTDLEYSVSEKNGRNQNIDAKEVIHR